MEDVATPDLVYERQKSRTGICSILKSSNAASGCGQKWTAGELTEKTAGRMKGRKEGKREEKGAGPEEERRSAAAPAGLKQKAGVWGVGRRGTGTGRGRGYVCVCRASIGSYTFWLPLPIRPYRQSSVRFPTLTLPPPDVLSRDLYLQQPPPPPDGFFSTVDSLLVSSCLFSLSPSLRCALFAQSNFMIRFKSEESDE